MSAERLNISPSNQSDVSANQMDTERYHVVKSPRRSITQSSHVPFSVADFHHQRAAGFTRSSASTVPSYLSDRRSVPSEWVVAPVMPRKVARPVEKSKGLRHFSHKVCEKVQMKGRTNYTEVADELVAEYFSSQEYFNGDEQQDMKNIRRRVYDALNVFMAMNIIEKEKKEIRWVGLPTSSVQECSKLREEKMRVQNSIRDKSIQLQDLITQLVAFKSLIFRNRESERNISEELKKSGHVEKKDARKDEEKEVDRDTASLYLPFVVVSTDKKANIECKISHDKSEYSFSFDRIFEIDDDIEILKRLGLAHGLEYGRIDPEKRSVFNEILPRAVLDHLHEIFSPETLTDREISPPRVNMGSEPRSSKYAMGHHQQQFGTSHSTNFGSAHPSPNFDVPIVRPPSHSQYYFQRNVGQPIPNPYHMRAQPAAAGRYRASPFDQRNLASRGVHRVISTGSRPVVGSHYAMQVRGGYEEEYDDDENLQY